MRIFWLLPLLVPLVHGDPNNQLTFSNTNNIPEWATTSCMAADGVLYIDTLLPFTRPTPTTLPSCATGYTFAILTNTLLYYSALQVAAQCMSGGASFWAQSVGNADPGATFGYYMLVAAMTTTSSSSVAKHGVTATGERLHPVNHVEPTKMPESAYEKAEGAVQSNRFNPDMDTLYPPIPYVCLNTQWTSSY